MNHESAAPGSSYMPEPLRKVAAVFLTVSCVGCAGQGPAGSGPDIREAARREAFGRCISKTMYEYRNVPTFAVWRACGRMVRQRLR